MVDAPVHYRVSSDGTIVSVDASFEAFARANGAPDLARTVIGQPIASYLAGPEVRSLYEILMERVRARRSSLTFPFRCDAPDLRRFMRMKVDPTDDGGLCFTALLERTEARPPVPVELLMSTFDAPGEDDLMSLCAWCKRIELEDGEWHEVEEAMTRGLLDRDRPLAISHAACPRCEAEMMALL